MSSVVKRWRRPGLFLLGGLLSLCAPTGHAGDSVTSTWGIADESHHLIAALDQAPGDGVADLSRGSGDQDAH